MTNKISTFLKVTFSSACCVTLGPNCLPDIVDAQCYSVQKLVSHYSSATVPSDRIPQLLACHTHSVAYSSRFFQQSRQRNQTNPLHTHSAWRAHTPASLLEATAERRHEMKVQLAQIVLH